MGVTRTIESNLEDGESYGFGIAVPIFMFVFNSLKRHHIVNQRQTCLFVSNQSSKQDQNTLQGEEGEWFIHGSEGTRSGLVLEHQETLLMINTIPEMVPFYPNAFTKLGVK